MPVTYIASLTAALVGVDTGTGRCRHGHFQRGPVGSANRTWAVPAGASMGRFEWEPVQ